MAPERILTGQGGDIVFFQSPSPGKSPRSCGGAGRAILAQIQLWHQLEAAARWNRVRLVADRRGGARGVAAPESEADRPSLARPNRGASKATADRSLIRSQLFHGASRAAERPAGPSPAAPACARAVLAAPVDRPRAGWSGTRPWRSDAFANQIPELVRSDDRRGSHPLLRPHDPAQPAGAPGLSCSTDGSPTRVLDQRFEARPCSIRTNSSTSATIPACSRPRAGGLCPSLGRAAASDDAGPRAPPNLSASHGSTSA
jgi:hypothetical protein